MLTKQEARTLVLANVCASSKDEPLELLDSETIERPWGWVFFYQAKRFIETGKASDALAGNAPIFVTRSEGSLIISGTAYPVDYYIDKFEREGSL